MSTFPFDNENIGSGPFLTMKVSETTGQTITQNDLDSGLAACIATANNTVGKGAAGERVLGKVIWVSQELVSGTLVPVLCSVQARGVARFKYTSPTPVIGQHIEADGTGKVRQASTSEAVATGGLKHTGLVIAVDSSNTTVDVFLG